MTSQCYVISGPNGSGKTTFARHFLPRYIHCLNFINPDLIALGLSPFAPDLAMFKAGRIVLKEIRQYIAHHEHFAIETTLSGRTFISLFDSLRSAGYEIHGFYLWLPNPELAIERIRDRVENGGHHIQDHDVHRRFGRSLHNLFNIYRSKFDSLSFFDNATAEPMLIFRDINHATMVCNTNLYHSILDEVTT